MAQTAEVVLIDDLDGSRAQETLAFGLDGRHFEIGLSAANAQRLRGDLEAYVRAARTTAPPRPRPKATAIRRWAQDHGYEVSDRGLIHRDVLEAYNRTEGE